MSSVIAHPNEAVAPRIHPVMEIRGWWALGSVLFYPLLAYQLFLPLRLAMVHGLAGLFHADPFRVFLTVSLVSRLLLILIVSTGLARAVVAAWGIHARHERVKEYFRTTQIPSTVIKDRLTALQAYRLPFVVYGDPVPRAFVLGILRTRIYLSTGLLEALSDFELGSVIMHEVHHHRNKDPFKGFLLSIFSHLFFYVPVIRHYAEFWQQHREWEADAAARRVSDSTSLAQALCKLLAISPFVSGHGGFAISSAQTSAASPALHGMGNVRERIELLLDLRQTRPWRIGAKEYAHSVVCLVLLALLCVATLAPVSMNVHQSLTGQAYRKDAAGWIQAKRFDSFWVPAFQSEPHRVKRVGVDEHTTPPDSRHVLVP